MYHGPSKIGNRQVLTRAIYQVRSRMTDLELLRKTLALRTAIRTARVCLILMSGLPGSGKSHISRYIANEVRAVIVESDLMRKILVPAPAYSGRENARLFIACHALIEHLLRDGYSVLFDATNLIQRNRSRLYNIANKVQSKLVIVEAIAPLTVVTERLAIRQTTRSMSDNSDADMTVYVRMASKAQPIRSPHFTIDTSMDITQPIDNIKSAIQSWTGN